MEKIENLDLETIRLSCPWRYDISENNLYCHIDNNNCFLGSCGILHWLKGIENAQRNPDS